MADKTPSAWLIEKALAAWNAAMERLEDDREFDDIWDAEIDVPDVRDILHRLIQSAVHAGDMAIMAAKREAEIAQRKARYLAREQALRQVVQDLMETIGETRAEFGDVSAALSKGRESVVITDEAKLPPGHLKTTITHSPDKRLILADLKEGAVIDGAELSNARMTLTIRTK